MKGIYCLVISVKKDVSIEIGKIGTIRFKRGKYVYIGSAQNNIEKRVNRHRSKNKKKHWHIDYLLTDPSVEVKEVLYKKAGKEAECEIARRLNSTEEPVHKFGCSDCRCNSHLFRMKNMHNMSRIDLKLL